MFTDKSIAAIALVVLIALAMLGSYLVITYGWGLTIAGVVILISVVLVILWIKRRIKYSNLIEKYQDEQLVNKLMRRTLWKGQTAEQVIDAIGEPKEIDEKVLKTKTKQTWKYFPSGRRRYGLRITLDDDLVVGWDKKI